MLMRMSLITLLVRLFLQNNKNSLTSISPSINEDIE